MRLFRVRRLEVHRRGCVDRFRSSGSAESPQGFNEPVDLYARPPFRHRDQQAVFHGQRREARQVDTGQQSFVREPGHDFTWRRRRPNHELLEERPVEGEIVAGQPGNPIGRVVAFVKTEFRDVFQALFSDQCKVDGSH